MTNFILGYLAACVSLFLARYVVTAAAAPIFKVTSKRDVRDFE